MLVFEVVSHHFLCADFSLTCYMMHVFKCSHDPYTVATQIGLNWQSVVIVYNTSHVVVLTGNEAVTR